MNYIANLILDKVFYGVPNIPIEINDDFFIINANSDGDIVWQGDIYNNGDFRSLSIRCQCGLGRAFHEARAEYFNNDINEMIDYLNSEEAENLLIKRFEESIRRVKNA